MSQKMLQSDGSPTANGSSESISSEDLPRKTPVFGNLVLEVMRKHSVQNFLEPMIRKVVKEEIGIALRGYSESLKRNDTSDSHSSLRLRFCSTLSLPVFTGTRIEGEDGSSIKVDLVDAFSEDVIQSGPESSAQLEIVVLEGDFDGDSYSKEEFKNNIVREREGKKPLLGGDVYLSLKHGMGVVGDISFTDNSSWTRSHRFRLGARLVGDSAGVVVKEAKTESFVVRDHRGELYKKHYPPSLFDEVWRLEKIGKDGAFHKRLSADRVNTVKDFLILLNLDPARLRKILGPGMSAKMWDVTIEHALTCVIDKRVYVYYSPTSPHINCVAFNIAGEVLGLLTQTQYVRANQLEENQKLEAKELAISAFQNWGGVTSFDDENSLLATGKEASDCNDILPPQSTNTVVGYTNATSSLDTILDNYGLHAMDLDLGYEDPLGFPPHLMDSTMYDNHSLVEAFYDDDLLALFNAPYQNFSSFLQPTFSGGAINVAQRRWRLVFHVLQWFFLLRFVVIRRSRTHPMSRYC